MGYLPAVSEAILEKRMSKKLSPLWVCSQHGERLHRKREYSRFEGLTLCGIHVGKGWWIVAKEHLKRLRKCRRCRA